MKSFTYLNGLFYVADNFTDEDIATLLKLLEDIKCDICCNDNGFYWTLSLEETQYLELLHQRNIQLSIYRYGYKHSAELKIIQNDNLVYVGELDDFGMLVKIIKLSRDIFTQK